MGKSDLNLPLCSHGQDALTCLVCRCTQALLRIKTGSWVVHPTKRETYGGK